MNVTIRAKCLFLLLAVCICGACHYGLTVSSYPPAHSAHGAEAEIVTVSKEHFMAELIGVRDSDIVILVDGKLELRPYASIKSLEIKVIGKHFSIGGKSPSEKNRDDLRLFSRFPQGLSPELLAKLLQAYGQSELARAKP